MLHDQPPITPTYRTSVFLDGALSQCHLNAGALKRYAAAEATNLLAPLGTGTDIWVHSFDFEGREFLLSTYKQPSRVITRKNGHRSKKVRLPARLVVEVALAPVGLTMRTILRPRKVSEAPSS